MKIVELTGVSSGAGVFTAVTSAENIMGGYVEKIVYAWTNGDATADVTISCESQISEPILVDADLAAAVEVYYPRIRSNLNTTGAVLTGLEGNKPYIVGRLKLAIATPGNSKTYRYLVYLSDE